MQSAPWMFSPRWPMATEMPWRSSSSVEPEEFMSEPVTVMPRSLSTSARGRMLTPPMPTIWTRLPGFRNSASFSFLIIIIGCTSRFVSIQLNYYTAFPIYLQLV